jgi:hypothetical protein
VFDYVFIFFNAVAICIQIAFGAFFLLVAYKNIRLFFRLKHFAPTEGVVSKAIVGRLFQDGNWRIEFKVSYSYFGTQYEGAPAKFRPPYWVTEEKLNQLKRKYEGKAVSIRVNPQRPAEFVFDRDAYIPIHEWFGCVMIPALFAAVCFFCPIRM